MFAHSVSGNDFVSAAASGDLAIVKLYIAENAANPAAINYSESFRKSAIFEAAANGHTHIVAELLKIPELNVNAGNVVGARPIFVASVRGHVDVVQLLVNDKRTDVNARTDFDDVPLNSAISQGRAAVVKLLLSAGANVSNYDELMQIASNKKFTEIVSMLSEWNDNAKKYSQIGMFLLPYLSESDQLKWRSTSRFYREALQNMQAAPWRTKAQFCMAVTGNFENHWYMLNQSWKYYCRIIADADQQPAIIHKLRAWDSLSYGTESERDSMRSSGRLYSPSIHNWAFNAIWMLANIHKGRSFLVISEMMEEYRRRSFGTSSSAFAREIAAAMQAKYTPCVLGDNLLRLTPPDENARSQVKLNDMKLSDARVAMFYKQCKEYKENPPKTILPDESLGNDENVTQNLPDQKSNECVLQ